ncbi:MAG: hypothetical protein M0Q53_06995 [Prolixibacteraceae bacterium]|jgi:hypothetical protein|nr:hypothetical protein [Prolixibacteraceae bacterium]
MGRAMTVFYHKWDHTRKRILEITLADSKAGVYCDPEWINLVKSDPALMEEFDKAVAKNNWIGE